MVHDFEYRYFSLFIIYTPYTIYKCELHRVHSFPCSKSIKLTLDGILGWLKMIVRDGWKCTPTTIYPKDIHVHL